jgi:hypothetical protein
MTILQQLTIAFIYLGAFVILWIAIDKAKEGLRRKDCEHRFTFDDGNKKRCLDCKKKLKK